MVAKRSKMNAQNEADRCFDKLIAHGFIIPTDMDVTGKVKSCKMHDLIHEFVTEIARDENFVKNKLPPELAHRLSVRNRVQPQEATQKLHVTYSKACCWNICNPVNRSYQIEADESSRAMLMFLESLRSPAQAGVLEVLDLEDCKGLKDHHLKKICNDTFQLKYLSLRNTDITKLPKQLKKLRYLLTLDIRQTKVRILAKNSCVLPRLKHLLASHQNYCTSQDSNQSEEAFVTVKMPISIGTMTELQVLSFVAVSKSASELIEIGNLLQLRKLGVVIYSTHGRVFMHLYHTIEKLSRSLRTMSIRIIDDNENADMRVGMDDTLVMPPKHLQKLEISGLTTGLPGWVEHLKELTKLTLHKTLLTTADIEIICKITSLDHLCLRQVSCNERTLTFSEDGFQSLKFLVIECSVITSIKFVHQATTKLKKIVWSSIGLQSLSLSGIEHLRSLEELKLTGEFNLERVQKAIAANKNNPVLKIE